VADDSTMAIAKMSHSLAHDPLPGELTTATRLRIIDTIGCAVSADDSPPASAGRRLALREGAPSGRVAHVIGWNTPASVELAGFVNAAMARYLDYNDTYTNASPGHPSDMIPGLLALAEAEHAPGTRLVTAIVCAYEGFGVISKQLSVRERGWDQGVLVGLGAACGAAALLGLTEQQTAEAISLVVTAGIPARSSRAGALSMWKGCATASSSRLGIFSAMLAAEGMTGPERAIEGKHGLWEQATGPFTVAPFGPAEPWVLTSSSIKLIPAEYNSHVAVELMLQLRAEFSPADIESVHVSTYWNAFDEIGNDPSKWDPRTRETADHSLPYLLTVAMFDGAVSPQSFDDAHLRSPDIRAFMQRISVAEDKGMTAAWPATVPARIDAVLTDGSTWSRSADYPRGHPKRPATSDDITAKFLSSTPRVLGDSGAREALQVLSGIDALDDVGAIFPALRAAPTA
jgi:2-methylcitrate dehydratase